MIDNMDDMSLSDQDAAQGSPQQASDGAAQPDPAPEPVNPDTCNDRPAQHAPAEQQPCPVCDHDICPAPDQAEAPGEQARAQASEDAPQTAGDEQQPTEQELGGKEQQATGQELRTAQEPGDEQQLEAVEETVTDEQPPQPLPPCPDIKPVLEALLFAADGPITANRLAEALDGKSLAEVRQALAELQQQYNQQSRGFALEEIAGGYQLLSRPAYAPYLERFQKKQSRTKLSAAALETLAIVAYKQPVSRADIESVRGVQAGPILRMLIDKGMVHIVGRQEVIGRPFLYGTTRKFLEHFGLKALADLPQVEQLRMP